MSQPRNSIFKLSFLAAAILSLSACSTPPRIPGVDLGQIGNGLSKMGSKTKELSSNAWEGTKGLLNIGPQDSELLDEVDLALMEENTNIDSVQVASNDALPLLPQDDMGTTLTNTQPLLPQNDTLQGSTAFGQIPEQPVAGGSVLALGDAGMQQPQEQLIIDETFALETEVLLAEDTETAMVASNDMTHVVTESENLWTIAKSTTGDANNWHVIADINNLNPNASVFIGQKLIIPADMVKPVEAVAQIDVEQPVAVDAEQPAIVALNIPKNQTEETVTATAEQTMPSVPADAANIMTDATALKVGAGETLWDFAKRTTGDATNWKSIADKNLFDEKQLATIRPGQKIYVPTDMVRSRDASGVLIALGAEETGTVGGMIPQNKEAIAASAAVLAGTNQPDGQVKIVEAAYQDNDGITPVTAESLSQEAALAVADNDDKDGKVMVSGTYYPKAVYNEADFSSSLLMRVSPGTQLLVSKAIGPWLEVKTEKGVGYVHSRDIK